MAILAKDTVMLEVFAAGGDVHRQNAIDLGLTDEKSWDGLSPTLKKSVRDFAKTFLYGLGYGGSPETMKTKTYCPCPRCVEKVPQTLALTRDQIKRASDRWAKVHEPILTWRRELVESVKGYGRDHTWTSPFGYRRFFLEPRSQAERSIYNFPMQHCASQIINAAMVQLNDIEAPLVLQLHDSLMLEVRTEDALDWDRCMKIIMESKVQELDGWSFPTEGKMGVNWGEV